MTRANGRAFSALALSAVAISTAHEPSLSVDALAAVTVPFSTSDVVRKEKMDKYNIYRILLCKNFVLFNKKNN